MGISEHQAGPDFICIGMPNAGTRWLYDQLSSHEEISMPPVKEIHFLDRGMRYLSAAKRWENYVRRRERGRAKPGPDERFLDVYLNSEVSRELRCTEQKYYVLKEKYPDRYERNLGIELDNRHYCWYRSLFEPFKPKKTGDVTPGYFCAEGAKIRSLKRHCPDTRILLVVRNPVDKVVSTLYKHERVGRLTREQIESRGIATHLVSNARISTAYKSWVSVFGPEQTMVVFFDDIVSRPAELRKEICAYLGVTTSEHLFDRPAGFNRKAEGRVEQRALQIDRDLLGDMLADEIDEVQKIFGGVTLNW